MKWPGAVMLTALLLAGCRSSQPTTNPFMRTTVPPPGTGQGMMVMPGEPYPAGTVPPVVTPGMPAGQAPQAMTPGVPISPGPPAPLIPPTPSSTPRQEPFKPPGGSYLYHQSSIDRTGSGAPAGGVQIGAAAMPSEHAVGVVGQQVAASPSAVQQASYVDAPSADPTGAAHQETSLQFHQATANSRGDPPEQRASMAVGQNPVADNTVRIVAGPAAATAPEVNSSGAQGVIRMTVGESRPAVKSGGSDPAGAAGSRLAIVTPGVVSGSTTGAAGTTATVARTAAFQPVAASDYSHAADYRTLRGRLEYSQSLRQWKLRYIPIDGPTDTYGGSVVLADSPALASFKPGDMVAIRGVLAGGSGVASSFSPRYELAAIEPLSR